MTKGEHVGAQASTSLGVALALCSVPSVMSAMVLVPILPELFKVFGRVQDANFWIPTLLTIPGLCAAILSPLTGYIGDKLGLKGPIVISLVGFALFGAAPLLLNDFTLILVSRIALGFGQIGALVLSGALIGQQFSGVARDRWLALQTLAATSSSLFLLPLSGFLARTSLGWHLPFVLFLAALGLAATIARLPTKSVPRRVAAEEEQEVGLPWKWLIGQCVVTLFVGVLFYSAQLQIGLALSTVGVKDTGEIGLLSGVAVSGILLGSVLFVRLKTLFGAFLLPSALLLCGATLVLMKQFPGVAPLVILTFINMVACGLMLPALLTEVAARMPDAVRGRGIGIWTLSFTLGQFLAGAFVGAVLARPGATVLDAFVWLGVCALIMAPIGFTFTIARRRTLLQPV